ncbi:hypothetical protein KUCAC02_026657, partial [Chaenocephalus aceratus]
MDGATVTSRPAAEMKLSFSPPSGSLGLHLPSCTLLLPGSRAPTHRILERHSAASQHVAVEAPDLVTSCTPRPIAQPREDCLNVGEEEPGAGEMLLDLSSGETAGGVALGAVNAGTMWLRLQRERT